jgi:hypothetical protein
MCLLYPWNTKFFVSATANLLATCSNGMLSADPCTSASTRANHNDGHFAFTLSAMVAGLGHHPLLYRQSGDWAVRQEDDLGCALHFINITSKICITEP